MNIGNFEIEEYPPTQGERKDLNSPFKSYNGEKDDKDKFEDLFKGVNFCKGQIRKD